MNYRCVCAFILIYHIKDIGALCGKLSYQEPAIDGRNITLVFRPYHFQSDRTPIVTYHKPNGIRPSRQFPFKTSDKVYYIHVDSSVDDFNSSVAFVKYGACFSNTIRLILRIQQQKPVLRVPTLQEGKPANITCISKGGRPTSRLSIMIDERNMSGSSETISVNDTTTDTNTIQMTLNVNAKREWNSKYIICTQQTDLFTDNVSDRKIINCKYPPSTLFMEKPRPPLELQEVYFLTFRCNISDFNDNCSLNWNWDKSEQDSRTEQTNGLSTFVLNATNEDNEHTLICSVHCSSFQVNLSDSYTIRVPFLVNQRKESISEPCSCSPLPWVAAAVGFFTLIASIAVNVAVLRKKNLTSTSIERTTEKTPEIPPVSVKTEDAAEYRNTTPEIQTYEEIEMEIHTYEACKSSGEIEHPYGH